MAGGSPNRNAILPWPKPLEGKTWQEPTLLYSKESESLIEPEFDATLGSFVGLQSQNRSRQSQHLLPSRQPLVIRGMVFFRMLQSVRSYDLESGNFLQQTCGCDQLLTNLADPHDGRQFPNWQSFLGQLLNQRLWDDRTFGRLSSDGERLYCIEETGFWNPISSGGERGVIQVNTTSVLNAHDLMTGKLLWDAGGPLNVLPPVRNLADRFFLGPPLPMAGRLYCLVDVNQEIRLNVLNAATGELEWAQPLATPMQQTIAQDKARRTSGVSPAYADGVLVCPTDAGVTIALDLTTRSLLWGISTETGNANQFNPQARRMRAVKQAASSQTLSSGWIDSTPTIYRDKVVLTPLKSSKIYLLDLLTGKRLWEHPRGTGLYVAGITQGRVIVVGTQHVQSWSLKNEGKVNSLDRNWSGKNDGIGRDNPLRLSESPTGRGVIVESKLLLPAGKNLLVIDLKTGAELKPVPAPPGVELGNLVLAQGRLISQSVQSLDVIPFPKLDEAEAEK